MGQHDGPSLRNCNGTCAGNMPTGRSTMSTGPEVGRMLDKVWEHWVALKFVEFWIPWILWSIAGQSRRSWAPKCFVSSTGQRWAAPGCSFMDTWCWLCWPMGRWLAIRAGLVKLFRMPSQCWPGEFRGQWIYGLPACICRLTTAARSAKTKVCWDTSQSRLH